MVAYRSLSRRRKLATAILPVWLAVDLTTSFAIRFLGYSETDELGVAESLLIADLLLFIACIVLVARWIYRASSNAHALRDDLTITPGWAVGWYFVPIATWWKPYEAMKEIWSASFPTPDGTGATPPVMMRVWWGLWVGGNILGNISLQLSLRDGIDPDVATTLDVVISLISIPTVILLIRIMRAISRAQRRVWQNRTLPRTLPPVPPITDN